MRWDFKIDETKAYFELTKLKSSRNERRGLRRILVRRNGRMRVRWRMGKK
jgi:hypothetical protein